MAGFVLRVVVVLLLIIVMIVEIATEELDSKVAHLHP